ncbi:hypothetical protein BS78_02G183700 [Paspalum vaginatum]|nr:hypothetical protein BS78_02G183700 [Paspalum vaginatum]
MYLLWAVLYNTCISSFGACSMGLGPWGMQYELGSTYVGLILGEQNPGEKSYKRGLQR